MNKILILALLLTGCAVVTTVETAAQSFVSLYCSAPEKARLINRAIVASAIHPNKIEIICEGGV